ncbi:hypothetical protein WA026_007847 [Henosepilachna vigintioctopunctata]|uniref:Uncharacterized protein n=1 Tax=Henosepilachna vigintioctopunctata TaxID=420089 RepID=A0AAW1TYV1_9CUCU
MEDYSEEALKKRKKLQTKLVEEGNKGNIAYLKYDKPIIKENNTSQEKRKRDMSTSPSSLSTQLKNQPTLFTSKANRTNASIKCDPDRTRSNNKVTDIQPPPPSRLVLVGDRDHNPPTGKKRKINEYCKHQNPSSKVGGELCRLANRSVEDKEISNSRIRLNISVIMF